MSSKNSIHSFQKFLSQHYFDIYETYYEMNQYSFIKIYHKKHFFFIMVYIPKSIVIPYTTKLKCKQHQILNIDTSKQYLMDLHTNDKEVNEMYKNVVQPQMNFKSIDIDDVIDENVVQLKRQAQRYMNCVLGLKLKLIFLNRFYMCYIHNNNKILNYQFKIRQDNNFDRNYFITISIQYFFKMIERISNKIFIMSKEIHNMHQSNIQNYIEKNDSKNIINIHNNINVIFQKTKKCKKLLKQNNNEDILKKLYIRLHDDTQKINHLYLSLDQYMVDSIIIRKCEQNNHDLLETIKKIV